MSSLRPLRLGRHGAALGLALMVVGCGGGGTDAPPVDPSPVAGPRHGLEVRAATVQWVPGMTMAAVYLEVVDHDGLGDRLLRVETEMAAMAETHESLADGDTVRMEARPEGFEVPAAGTLRLEPGGKHIMLVEPTPPADGSPLALVLVFERAGPVAVEAEVLGGAMDHGAMDHGAMDHGAMGHDVAEPDNRGMGESGTADEATPSDDGSATSVQGGGGV